jgi:hypothetical protein
MNAMVYHASSYYTILSSTLYSLDTDSVLKNQIKNIYLKMKQTNMWHCVPFRYIFVVIRVNSTLTTHKIVMFVTHMMVKLSS